MINRDTYCSLAFTGFDNRVKSVCCWAKYFDNKYESFAELETSTEVKEMRQALLRGEKHSACRDCWRYEELGTRSMRQDFTAYKPLTELEQELATAKLKHLVIDSGNVCNLACRTCDPQSSSGHWKEKESIAKKRQQEIKVFIKKTDTDTLLAEDYSAISQISVLGGEPFQNLDHIRVLEKIVSIGRAGQCVLQYTTNATIKLPEKLKILFSQFKEVQFTLSIDAVGEKFSYIRTNGVWSDVVENLAELRQLPNSRLSVHPTISALNVLYLDELYQWFDDEGLPSQPVFVEGPWQYSFGIFKKHQKDQLLDKLQKSKFDQTALIEHIKSCSYQPMAKRIFNESIEDTQEFKDLDINDYLPELISLLNT